MQNFKKSLTNVVLAASSALWLGACATPTPKPIQVDAKPVQRATLVVPEVDQIQTRGVDWTVYSRTAAPGTAGSIEALHGVMDSRDAQSAFVLTPDQYENLSINAALSRQLLIQQQAQINAYKRYYQDQDGIINQYNRKK